MREMTRSFRAAAAIAVAAFALASLLGEASAAIPAAPMLKIRPSHPAVARLLSEAQVAVANGDAKTALIDLKLAAGMEPNNPTVLMRLGLVQNATGDYAGAEVNLRSARSLGAPDEQVLGPIFEAMLGMGEDQQVLDLFKDPQADDRTELAATILRARASAFQKLGNEAGALSQINRALGIHRNFDVLMTATNVALSQKRLSDARSLVDEALKLRPKNADGLVLKIVLALTAGDQKQALAIAEGMVAEKPRSLTARLARLKVYLAMGDDAKAKPEVDFLLKQTPGMMIAIYYRAVILARNNQLAAAWSVAHVLPPEFIQAEEGTAINVAQMAAGAGFLDSAATILDRAVFKHPNLFEARLKLVEFRLLQNSPQYALNTLAQVEDSKDPRVSILFAEAYLKTGRKAEAQKYIERAIELGGGEGLANLGKDVALNNLSSWLKRHPDSLVARKPYAILLLRFGDFANAKIQYEQLVREQPTDGLSFNNLSWLVVKDDPKRALALAVQAVRLTPDSPDYLDTLGSMQMGRADFKGAAGSLTQAHTFRPTDPAISYHLALALNGTGARAQARTLLASAVAQGGFAELEAARKLLKSWH